MAERATEPPSDSIQDRWREDYNREARRGRTTEPPNDSPKQVADMFYIVDRDGRLWWGANDSEQARQSVFSQGYTIVRVSPDGTWKVVTGA